MKYIFLFLSILMTYVVCDSSCYPKRNIMEILRKPSIVLNKNLLKIAWITKGKCDQFLDYGTDSNYLSVRMIANSTYLPQFKDSEFNGVYIHTVIFEDLESDVVYFYRFGGEEFLSNLFSFRSPKQRSAEIKMIMISNLDFDDNSEILINEIANIIERDPYLYDAIIDLGIDSPTSKLSPTNCRNNQTNCPNSINNPSKIAMYFDKLSKITSKIPYHGLNRANQMMKDYLGRVEKDNEMYLIQTDTLQLLFLDSDFIFDSVSGGRIKELEKVTLANSLEESNGWRILLSDRPFYCSRNDEMCHEYSDTMRDVYEKELINNHFSMVISGGSSQYERTYPVSLMSYDQIKNNSQNNNIKKPIYVTVNGPHVEKEATKNDFTAVSSGIPSFGILTINDYSEFSYTELSLEGDVIDSFTVISAVTLKYQIALWIVYGLITLFLMSALFVVLYLPIKNNSFYVMF